MSPIRKLAFLQKEPLSRLGVAFLLTVGVTLPLLLAMDLGTQLPFALVLGTLVLVALTALGATRRSRRILWAALAVFVLVQFFLPGMGVLGGWLEGAKALALYFSGYAVALPLFGGHVAGLIVCFAAVMSYVFAKRGVGFLPAAIIVVLMLFGLWSLGKANLFWYAAPALVALLLQMSQAAHEKINILHVLPMAVAAVLLAFLLLPAGRLEVAPLASAARSLKQMISDYLFFTEPRNVFTLGTYGYYPMGNNQLGGEAEPSEFPVMTVKTGQKTLLRAVVKDSYTGRSFVDTSSARRYLYINPRWQAQRRRAFTELLPGEAIRKASRLLDEKAVSVQLQNSAASTVFTPLFLRSLNMTGDMVPYFNDASELFITRDLKRDDRYTVYAPLVEGGQAGLDALVNAAAKTDEDFQAITAAYTPLPSHLEKKVYDDVQNIVRGETTPYGKALAIMRHLQKYYRYTLSPDTPPDNKDFVTYFLYVGKEGYCTYYAAAMTVMCRMAGLPARYVEGFLAMPEADGFAYVTGKDAHAWTEVYFEGFGWVPFDPTPIQQPNANNPPQDEPSPSPSPSPEDQPTPSPNPDTPPDEPTPEPQPSEEPDQPPEDQTPDTQPDAPPDIPWLWIALALAVAVLVARIASRSPERVAKRQATQQAKIFIYGAAVQRLLQYARRAPQRGETPLAFARRVDSVRVFPTPIAPLWRLLALSNYSRMELTQEHVTRARDTYRLVFKGSHLLRRLRFLLAAAFDPRFYRGLDTPAPHDKPPQGPTFTPPKPKGKTGPAAYSRNPAAAQSGAPTPKVSGSLQAAKHAPPKRAGEPARSAASAAPHSGKAPHGKPDGTPAAARTRPAQSEGTTPSPRPPQGTNAAQPTTPPPKQQPDARGPQGQHMPLQEQRKPQQGTQAQQPPRGAVPKAGNTGGPERRSSADPHGVGKPHK